MTNWIAIWRQKYANTKENFLFIKFFYHFHYPNLNGSVVALYKIHISRYIVYRWFDYKPVVKYSNNNQFGIDYFCNITILATYLQAHTNVPPLIVYRYCWWTIMCIQTQTKSKKRSSRKCIKNIYTYRWMSQLYFAHTD